MDHFSEKYSKKEGFTLLELLIVIAILAILGAIVIFVLNPAETLRETRDSQRIPDLSTIKSVLGVYLTATSTPFLASTTSNDGCKSSPTAAYANYDKFFYSVPLDVSSTTDNNIDGAGAGVVKVEQVNTITYRSVDGTGWIPVVLTTLNSGAPLDSWPVDPTNSFATGTSTAAAINTSALVYRYACSASPVAFEADARLESISYAGRHTTDGGNSGMVLEAGTDLRIIGGGDF